MAQDLLELQPDAVILTSSGYYKVDYDKLDVRMISLEEGASLATVADIVSAVARATRPTNVKSTVSIPELSYQAAL